MGANWLAPHPTPNSAAVGAVRAAGRASPSAGDAVTAVTALLSGDDPFPSSRPDSCLLPRTYGIPATHPPTRLLHRLSAALAARVERIVVARERVRPVVDERRVPEAERGRAGVQP